MKIILGKTHVSLVVPYRPAIRRRFFARYRNGITLRVWNAALHIWKPRPEDAPYGNPTPDGVGDIRAGTSRNMRYHGCGEED